jgi:hypothetical protein
MGHTSGMGGFGLMVFKATFSNISAMSWRSILLVEETTDLSRVTDKLAHSPANFIFLLGRLIFSVSINSHPDNIY